MLPRTGKMLVVLLALLVLTFSGAALAQSDAPKPTAASAAGGEAAKLVTPNMPPKVRDAIAKSLTVPAQAKVTTAVIDPKKEPGFLGVPGSPGIPYIWGLLWAIWVGWIFSTVGAFGGIMAGVGHITIFGLGNYAKSFGKGHPVNSLFTDSIRVSNQWLVGLSALISSFNYYKLGRLVLPLGLCLAIGSVAGSYLIPEFTAGKINLKSYIGYFGLCVLLLGCILFYETTPRGQRSKKKAKEAAAAFEKQVEDGDTSVDKGVKILAGSYGPMILALCVVLAGALWGNLAGALFAGSKYIAWALVLAGVVLGIIVTAGKVIRFSFYGVEFAFRGFIPILGGIVIAALASFLGVGGGFLFVPFLTSVAGLPMFLVAGTSALAVLVGMIVSIATYMVAKGVVVEWGFIGMELIGIFIGSMIGPRTSKYIPDKWLKIIFVILAFYVGIRYSLKGFAPVADLPTFIQGMFVL